MDFLHTSTYSRFSNQTDRGVIKVQERTEKGIDLLQGFKFGLCIKTIIPYDVSDGHIVFLFHKAIIIFVICPTSGKGDLIIVTPIPQLVIDKLSAVIAVDSFHRKGKVLGDPFNLFFYPSMGLIP